MNFRVMMYEMNLYTACEERSPILQ